MICKLNLNINRYCKGVLDVVYKVDNDKYIVNITACDTNMLEKLLIKLRNMIGDIPVRVNYKNLYVGIRDEMSMIVGKTLITENRVDSMVNLVKKYMNCYGKYPNFMEVEKAHNYIRNILGNIGEIEEIRLKILYGFI